MSAPYLTADATVSARRASSITTSDSEDFSEPTRGIYVGASGDLKVTFVSGGTVTLVGVPAGMLLPIQVIRVYATGTTASSLVALF